MALSVDTDTNLYIKQGEYMAFTVETESTDDIRALVGNTARFIAKKFITTPDADAILNLTVTISADDEIPIEFSSTITKELTPGTYYWGIELTQDGEVTGIVPEDSKDDYPKLIIGGDLIED